MIISIDPGITGAIYFSGEEGLEEVYDMPIMAKTSGKGNQLNAYALSDLITNHAKYINATDITAYVESVHAMPGQGVSSVFSFGKSAGIIEGVLAALGIPVVMVTPQKWKKAAGLIGKEKDAARTLAIQMYPQLAGDLTRKKDHGRADAILIQHFGCL